MSAGKVRLVEETEETEAPEVANLRAALAGMGLDNLQVPEPEAPRVITKRMMPDREILAAMAGLGAVLTVRLMLAAAAVGGFVLAFMASQSATPMAIYAFLAYAALVILPLVWLSTRRT